ncbi:enoyl-CoA hydratase [Pseudomonas linyingensis]|uniref:enoyl-CoA hydratase n=1 Tax=Pseudomonas linyingensis TaxID=915471 RepID=A0A1H7BF65_9PSED|nr:enoyl-CoA hydratase [Pseudomonas linyingensis]SEJ76128.1 enoyl-CoA hydratase [Pseudomonas linyingensis]
MNYKNLLLEMHGKVALITLNRPQVLNALSPELTAELSALLDELETDDEVAAVVLTGNEKAFAAGADIKAMKDLSYMEVYKSDFITTTWERLSTFRKPSIAAVSGYALGGGCELAMMCDFIIAADTAKFGQPEITIGTIPAAGGTQRLARFIGKAKAMDMVLTGRMMDAQEAERCGLVSRLVAPEQLIDEALKAAEKISQMSAPITMMAKEAVNRAFEIPLSEGIRFERRLFHSTFATEDQKEGMAAFSEKRKPNFKNR